MNGLIIQWKKYTHTTTSSVDNVEVSLPIDFSTTNYMCWTSHPFERTGEAYFGQFGWKVTSVNKIMLRNLTGGTRYIFAIGY